VPYTLRFADPVTSDLLVDNRALSLGLQDLQGYDAVHLARFDAFLRRLNDGQAQNYRDAEVFESGLGSALLDLVNVRYLVVIGLARAGAPDGLRRWADPSRRAANSAAARLARSRGSDRCTRRRTGSDRRASD
jgi:hypothetical protein